MDREELLKEKDNQYHSKRNKISANITVNT